MPHHDGHDCIDNESYVDNENLDNCNDNEVDSLFVLAIGYKYISNAPHGLDITGIGGVIFN